MSEQTPDSISEHEPSMEDILASIRKIIADDAPTPADTASAAIADDLDLSSASDDLDLAAFDTSAPAADPFDMSADLSADMAPEIDDSSTQALLDSVDFDLSEDMTLTDDVAAPSEDILDLTEMLDDPEIALAGDGSPVDALAIPEIPDVVVDDFDEMMDLAASDSDSDLTTESSGSDAALADVFNEIEAIADGDPVESVVTAKSPSMPAAEIDLPDVGEGAVLPSATDLDLGETVSGPDLDTLAIADIDALLGDDLIQVDAIPEAETVIDPAAELLETDTIFDDLALDDAAFDDTSDTVSVDDDIDLVKSLMADLTDDNFEDDNANLTVGDDDLDDIFEIALEDDLTEMAGIAATDGPTAPAADPEPLDDLAAIVAEANADAEAAAQVAANAEADVLDLSIDDIAYDDDLIIPEPDAKPNKGAIAALAAAAAAAGGAAIVGAQGDADDDTDLTALLENVDADIVQSEPEPEIETIIETENVPEASFEPAAAIEEDPMPHIVKSDSVASEETTAAASGAFASLNKVVEEKTVESESGPRIGDLVQDALKPMLQEWLDKNLKGIVDRAVAKEIKRISSGK